MAELGAGSGTGYPAALDTDTTQETDSSTTARADVPNDHAAAIVAIETELGTDPAGSKTDVKTRLAVALDNDGTLKQSHLLSEGVCRLKVGTYDGDGEVSQAITGVGFAPKYVKIWVRPAGVVATTLYEKVDDTWSTYAIAHIGASGSDEHQSCDDRVIAFGADGFTVDDGGGDFDPNKNGRTYTYMCLG